MISAVLTKLNGVDFVRLGFRLFPGRWQDVIRLALMLLLMFKRTADIGPCGNLLAVLFVAFDRTKRQSQRKRGIGIRRRSFDGKSSLPRFLRRPAYPVHPADR